MLINNLGKTSPVKEEEVVKKPSIEPSKSLDIFKFDSTPQPVITSKEEKKGDGDAVASVPSTLAWERYVDELAKEQQWIEVMAMRSPDRTVRQCGVKGNGCVHF